MHTNVYGYTMMLYISLHSTDVTNIIDYFNPLTALRSGIWLRSQHACMATKHMDVNNLQTSVLYTLYDLLMLRSIYGQEKGIRKRGKCKEQTAHMIVYLIMMSNI